MTGNSLVPVGQQQPSIDQSESKVGRDQVGSQIETQNNFYGARANLTAIDLLLEKLQREIEHDQQIRDTIDKLQRFQKPRAHDGVVGLEQKLQVSGRAYEYLDAIEKKELFAKLLEKFSLYASAQEILAALLARAEYFFTHFIYPQVGSLSILEVNQLVDGKIIEPTIDECGASVFAIDHSVAMGMIYWLAEQCHIRWHQ